MSAKLLVSPKPVSDLISGETGESPETAVKVLVPFDRREALTLSQAAKIADRSEATVRSWCGLHDIGRRVGGGNWRVSRVALAMFLDGDYDALEAYHSGDRASGKIMDYFTRAGLCEGLAPSAK